MANLGCSLGINVMKSREWYEDSIQSVLCECLKDLPPSNIRPAYLKTKQTNPFATNFMDVSNPLKDGVKGARNTTDIVYFWLHFDPTDLLSTEITATVESIINFKLTVTCYGEHSMPNAIRLKAFIRQPENTSRLLGMQAVLSKEPTITTFPEEINGEWWERNDVDFNFQVLVDDLLDGDGVVAGSDGYAVGYSKSTDGVIIVKEVGDGKKDS